MIFWEITVSSNMKMAMPEAAAVPARPTKWPEPMLLPNKEAPTWTKNKEM